MIRIQTTNRLTGARRAEAFESSENLPTITRKPSRFVRGVLFFLLSILSGTAIGFGWQSPQLAWLGIAGISLFLVAQLRHRQLFSRIASALMTGYFSFAFANPWMQSTIESLSEVSAGKAFLIAQGTHCFHAGSFCLFATLWWLASRYLKHGWILAPFALAIAEAIYPALFPMRQGCLLADAIYLTQSAAIFGVSIATIQVVVIASLLPALLTICGLLQPELWLQPNQTSDRKLHLSIARSSIAKSSIAFAITITTLNLMGGASRIAWFNYHNEIESGEVLSVLCLQQDTEYATFHADLVKKSSRASSEYDLVIWPECALGTYDRELTDFSDSATVAKNSHGIGAQFRPWPQAKTPLLAGGYSFVRKLKSESSTNGFGFAPIEMESKYVSAYLFDTDEKIIGRHDKSKLMAGGEYIPAATWWPSLAQWLSPPEEDEDSIPITAGAPPKPIGEVQGVSIGALLCCEDMHWEIARELTQSGADLLVCMANGMAFDSDPALHQHFVIGRFRAIENNRYFARCGSFGKTCLVSPVGEIVKSVPTFAEAELSLQIPMKARALTPFTRFGHWLWLGLMVVFYAGVTGISHRRKR